jgi:hypothetical protein
MASYLENGSDENSAATKNADTKGGNSLFSTWRENKIIVFIVGVTYEGRNRSLIWIQHLNKGIVRRFQFPDL